MNKKKKVIIIGGIALILIAGGIWAYFHFSKEKKEDTNVATNELTEEEICQDQYGINATSGDIGHCKCKDGYERSADRTKCILITQDTENTTQYTDQAIKTTTNAKNTFYGLDTEENDEELIPVKRGSEGKQFEEKKYNFDFGIEPDYKLEEGEELTIENNSKIQAISNKDEDYLSSIINGINNKKKFSENSQQQTTSTSTTKNSITNNTVDRSLPLVENFIGTIETKVTDEGILYQYTFTDPDFGTTPIRVGFISKTVVTNSDINTDIGGNGININKLKFHGGISNVEVTKDFGITRCWPFEPEGYVFKAGKNTFSLKGYSEEGFTYINYFRGQIYPVFSFPRTELSQGNKNCMVEIGRKENFTTFPFELKGSFENAVVAVTKNKDSNSNCMALLGNHDNIMVIYNEEIACEVWYNNGTSLREISTK